MKPTWKRLAPPALRRFARAAFGWRWFRGDYANWTDACAAATGYDDPAIIERVLAATLAVRQGQAAFERDSVLFPDPAPDRPLLEALGVVRDCSAGRLRVLDFGGALGSTYWRHRVWLTGIPDLAWDVVEQPRLVATGRNHLADTPVRFFSSVDEAEAATAHDVLLCGTTLQYLEDPWQTLGDWVARSWRFLLFNNLPLHRGKPDRLRVQHVPPGIYPASYPVWFFNRERLLTCLTGRYEIVREFASEEVWPVGWGQYRSTGLLLRRKDPS